MAICRFVSARQQASATGITRSISERPARYAVRGRLISGTTGISGRSESSRRTTVQPPSSMRTSSIASPGRGHSVAAEAWPKRWNSGRSTCRGSCTNRAAAVTRRVAGERSWIIHCGPSTVITGSPNASAPTTT